MMRGDDLDDEIVRDSFIDWAERPSKAITLRTVKTIKGNIIRSGYLNKLAMVSGRNWKKRFFVLNSWNLSYYVDDSLNQKPKGEIHITTDSEVAEESVDLRYGYGIKFFNSLDSIVLAAANEEERKSWIASIRSAISAASRSLSCFVIVQPDSTALISNNALPRLGLFGGSQAKVGTRKYIILHEDLMTVHPDRLNTSKIEAVLNLNELTRIECVDDKERLIILIDSDFKSSRLSLLFTAEDLLQDNEASYSSWKKAILERINGFATANNNAILAAGLTSLPADSQPPPPPPPPHAVKRVHDATPSSSSLKDSVVDFNKIYLAETDNVNVSTANAASKTRGDQRGPKGRKEDSVNSETKTPASGSMRELLSASESVEGLGVECSEKDIFDEEFSSESQIRRATNAGRIERSNSVESDYSINEVESESIKSIRNIDNVVVSEGIALIDNKEPARTVKESSPLLGTYSILPETRSLLEYCENRLSQLSQLHGSFRAPLSKLSQDNSPIESLANKIDLTKEEKLVLEIVEGIKSQEMAALKRIEEKEAESLRRISLEAASASTRIKDAQEQLRCDILDHDLNVEKQLSLITEAKDLLEKRNKESHRQYRGLLKQATGIARSLADSYSAIQQERKSILKARLQLHLCLQDVYQSTNSHETKVNSHAISQVSAEEAKIGNFRQNSSVDDPINLRGKPNYNLNKSQIRKLAK